ncbi:beta-amylase [Marchantia polymorpha subsp. ruderalis]|uniref:Beta-amylase n=2 Tax=Marchantia polymorpha TaxID=3197 RepID=A0A176VRB0_MARPO|nr:hypothetical protein AXG93_285s1000 [Marchantia polymorpha subsp. ruderalis]PTQ39843.1 hypothetical protein MARPO_0043s0084 [Marchantia polymorpha]BBM97603.1 hypothetical protein Mp_1g06930 [Marchantia polymorpha subsp. ruderalis]|eukprot:PTQ39843.1 hypothetical protein MARPO_0043s0084 [Marchantia polymorpha]
MAAVYWLVGPSTFLGSSRSVVAPESSAVEIPSSSNVVDGPVRVRCVIQGSSLGSGPGQSTQRSSKDFDTCLTASSFPSTSLSTSPPSSSPSADEWWRSQGSRGSHPDALDMRMFGIATEGQSKVADWELGSTPWLEHHLEETSTSRGTSGGVPVFVMLPLDSVNMNNTVNRKRAMNAGLLALKSAGVEGIMMDVWWGIVEKDGPMKYNWSGYIELINMARKHGLKVQCVMSFHQCGGNVGDSCNIPLPPWVVEEIKSNNDLVYTDKYGNRNYEYLSLGCDSLPVLKGRTPVQVYSDFMRSFRDTFKDLLGDTVIEIQVGMGPAGELRYPGYPEQNGRWRFPGIGEFQCYDKYMIASLKSAAEAIGKPAWGHGGPSDAGDYNRWPDETAFFSRDGGWKSAYGEFFLDWYSKMLINHGEKILSAAAGIFRGTGAVLSGKVAGIHWHYGTRSHAAELTAGYYNTRYRDGYAPIARMFGRHGVTLNFTCIEMKDEEQPPQAACSPESLLRQVTVASRTAGVRLAGENALPRFDQTAYNQVVKKSRLQFNLHGDSQEEQEPMCAFTYLRMSESLFQADNWRLFVPFVRHMQEGRTFQPWEQGHQDSESHVHATRPLVQEAAQALMYH